MQNGYKLKVLRIYIREALSKLNHINKSEMVTSHNTNKDAKDVESVIDAGANSVEIHDISYNRKDVDGGYAWVVLAASTTLFCVFGSTMKCFGIFFNGFVQEFNASSSITALIPGVTQGSYSILTLPILTVGLRYFSSRQFAVVTGVLASSAFIAGSFVQNVNLLVITNGMMIGMAFAFVHGPVTYLNAMYFCKRRNLAQAVFTAGISFGGFVLPPLYTLLIEYYGLRGAMLITGGFELHIIALALLLKPKVCNSTNRTKENANNNNKKSTNPNTSYKFRILEKADIKPLLKPNIRNGRTRSQSETHYHHHRASLDHRMGALHAFSENEIHTNNSDHHKSVNKFLDKVSNSNITRLLGEDDMVSMSLLELRGNFLRSSESVNTELSSTGCFKKYSIDCSVFRHWFMWIYFFVYCFGSIGSAYVIIFVAPFAKDKNINPERVASLVSIVNACDFLGRLLNGVIVDRQILKNHQTVLLTLFVTTLCLSLSPFYSKYWHFVVFASVSGLFAGGLFAMSPSVIADFLGMDNFRTAMGVLVLGQGFTLGFSAPFIGYLRDLTGSYIASFYFMAGCQLLAVVVFSIGLVANKKLLR